MKKLLYGFIIVCLLPMLCCTGKKEKVAEKQPFVTVGEDGNFYIGDSVYKFLGTNFWYGAILASEGQGGNRERLQKELDLMQEMGIENLRVLVGAEGSGAVRTHIQPILQPQPGVYNDTLLDGLDYLMAELERRDMKAVLYLTNAWQWSGGYGTYLQWAGSDSIVDPNMGDLAAAWDGYLEGVSKFVTNDSAKAMLARHIDFIVSRENRYTQKPYSESPALMAWEIANEPRAFASDSVTLAAFYDWVLGTAAQIKALDPNHLVSTGSEGMVGCEESLDLWADIHNSPNIDYAIIHIWPYNWNWTGRDRTRTEAIIDSVQASLRNTEEYIQMHAERTNKPLVIEEFGYPRDYREIAIGTPTTARDIYYEGLFDMIANSDAVKGCNFWGWGGYAKPTHKEWQPFDDYTTDPAHEDQGYYAVFASDSTTMDIIRKAVPKIVK